MNSMELDDPAFLEILQARNTGEKLMGLDLGTKTIGIAYSDVRLKIASARETLKREKFTKDARKLIALIEKEHVFAIVLGMPYNMDGSEGPRAQSTRAFARNFAQLHQCPIVFHDERLSSHAAEEAMIEADLSRKKRSAKIDAVAAAVILQGALDRLQPYLQDLTSPG